MPGFSTPALLSDPLRNPLGDVLEDRLLIPAVNISEFFRVVEVSFSRDFVPSRLGFPHAVYLEGQREILTFAILILGTSAATGKPESLLQAALASEVVSGGTNKPTHQIGRNKRLMRLIFDQVRLHLAN
jgi:hypothetical protein